ncbi:FtsW/RodA/SpoVE family cell cycle protein [Piscinibacter sp.]|uniref:FtsW/RodA/SpoVE family cell cycle protein n=1 Tax=Piscinibacter sp. TaxID=1903157 RepID=UPI002C806C8A|nr:FtsW/RodA/SpoVE family cell cycle protein [Albitalea sp.]HUG21278.1 FtsW/RodA/SpoVE family cell cycle protein [Albitalea sp.]
MTPLSAVASAPRERSGKIARTLPALVETLLVLGAIALLLPAFARLAAFGDGRDGRFAEAGFWVQGLPEPTLPPACAAHGAQADPSLRERLCGAPSAGAPQPLARLPLVLRDALSRATQAFLEPVRKAQARMSDLRLQQREGIGDLRDLSAAVTALEADTRPFVERFALGQVDEAGPAPLVCATQGVEAALAEPAPSAADTGHGTARANAVLLLAAAFDGHAATGMLASTAALPADSERLAASCGARGLAHALSSASALMAGARQSLSNSRKNEAMRSLLQSAGRHWAGGMLLGFALLHWSRRNVRPALGVAAALALWALAAWVSRVPLPFVGRAFEPARLDIHAWSPPSNAVLALAGAGLLLALLSTLRPAASRQAPRGGQGNLGAARRFLESATRQRRAAFTPQTMSSRLGYPGLVLATGLGWLLLLDLSAHGHAANRYLALYHQGHLWLGLLAFSVLLFLRQPLARGLAWALSVSGETARQVRSRLGTWQAGAIVALAALALVAVFGLALANMRQLTSELGRVWLIVGAAWFFFLRGGPLAERLARSGGSAASALRYVGPLLFVILVLMAAMLVTRDMGPLLIACYASGAFLAASVAMWWHQRSGQTAAALLFAVALFAAWIAATTMALFKVGAIDSVTAARLESLAAPLASTNDQLALVSWFRQAAPPEGFGIGAVPWCGYSPAGHCGGLPAQIHSDYTFTAVVGAFGSAMAWMVAIGCAVWLHRLIRHHGRVTRGEPTFVRNASPSPHEYARRFAEDRPGARPAGLISFDGQAFLSWIAVTWVVLTLCQLAVTVAGNLAVLPLTGVTFPFVSFGMTSLVVNMGFLALCLSVDLPAMPTQPVRAELVEARTSDRPEVSKGRADPSTDSGHV